MKKSTAACWHSTILHAELLNESQRFLNTLLRQNCSWFCVVPCWLRRLLADWKEWARPNLGLPRLCLGWRCEFLEMDVVVVRIWYVRYLGWLGKFDPEAPDSENLLSFYCKMFYVLWIYRYILSFIIHFSFQKQWGPDNSVDSNTCHCMGNAVAGSLCLFLMFLFVCLSVCLSVLFFSPCCCEYALKNMNMHRTRGRRRRIRRTIHLQDLCRSEVNVQCPISGYSDLTPAAERLEINRSQWYSREKEAHLQH